MASFKEEIYEHILAVYQFATDEIKNGLGLIREVMKKHSNVDEVFTVLVGRVFTYPIKIDYHPTYYVRRITYQRKCFSCLLSRFQPIG